MSQSKEHVGDETARREEMSWEKFLESIQEDASAPGNPGKDKDMDNAGGPRAGDPKQNPHGIEAKSGKKLQKKEETKPEKGKDREDSVQKRPKRASRKELLELIQRKNKMLQAMEKAVQKARQELENKDDKMLRMAAEFENYKKRTRREWELLQKKANADLIKDLLGILDDFDRALDSSGNEEDHFHSGIRLIHSGLLEVLRRAGLKEVEAQGVPFNPQFHEAMGEIDTDDTEEGFVAHVVQKGYMLNELLLRPARVIVAKKREET